MRIRQITLIALSFSCVSTLVVPVCAADDSEALRMLKARLRETNVVLADQFDRRVDTALRDVQQFGRGKIVFGRIQVEGDVDPRAVVSQMIIQQDGYFVDAIGDHERPIGFRMNGFANVEVKAKGDDSVEDLGTIQLKRLTEEQLCTVHGRLNVESHASAPKLDQITVTTDLPAFPINTPHNGTEGISGFYRPGTSPVAADGTFSVKGLCPGKHTLVIKAPNCVMVLQPIELVEGKTTELDPIRLNLRRQFDIEFAVSTDGDFNDVEFKQQTLKADDRWRANDQTPDYGFDLMIGQKADQLLLKYSYAPCHIMDLGQAQLDDELKIDMAQLNSKQPQNVPVEEGHVYVIHQKSWKHWILMRTANVGKIAVGGN